MKRNIVNKAEILKCSICNLMVSSSGLPSHIKHTHKMAVDEYVIKYGEFRKNKLEVKKGNRNILKIKCGICSNEYSIVGMYTHLRDSHNLSIEEYIQNHGEYRPKYLKIADRLSIDSIECKECSSKLVSHQQLAHHVRTEHNMKMKTYVLKHIYNNKHPFCKCGCGEKINVTIRPPYREYISGHNSKNIDPATLLKSWDRKKIIDIHFAGEEQYCKCGCGELIDMFTHPPYRRDYIFAHVPSGMLGRKHKQSSILKMQQAAYNRPPSKNKSSTKPELYFESQLQLKNIEYIKQYYTSVGKVDFKVGDYLIEIDGTYWHTLKLENLNFQLINSATNDYNKNSNLINLIRIREDNVQLINFECFDDLKQFNELHKYPTQKSLQYFTKVLTKEYISRYLQLKGKDNVSRFTTMLLRFIRTFQPNFPIIPSTENLNDVIQKINKYDVLKIYNPDTKTFNNNCSSLGISYLKSNFNSYWKSSYKNTPTPIEAWYDDNIMLKVISYRIGLNESNEVFDFSIHQLIRGLSARRYTISFFKPILAASIYKYFLGDIENPIVLDPCAGFGGRLLAFKSLYPEGTYVGIEPNTETFDELNELSKNFNNVILINSKLEDVDIDIYNPDLTFTSIPYYDLETYSETHQYDSFTDWIDTFINKLISCKNLLLNIPLSLQTVFKHTNYTEYKIQHNTSHLDSAKKMKYELLLKFT